MIKTETTIKETTEYFDEKGNITRRETREEHCTKTDDDDKKAWNRPPISYKGLFE